MDLLLIETPSVSDVPSPLTVQDYLMWRYFHDECEKRSVDYPDLIDDVNVGGLLSLAAHIMRSGYSVDIIRQATKKPQNEYSKRPIEEFKSNLLKKVRDCRPQVVGIGPYTHNYELAIELLGIVKRQDPSILTVIGGHHATFLDQEIVSKESSVDIVVRGPAEGALTALMKHHLRYHLPISSARIPGTTFKSEGGGISRSNGNIPINLDEEPAPAYDICLSSSGNNISHIVNVSMSRGCPYDCLFCSERSFWGNPQNRPADEVLSDIRYLRDKHGIRFFRLTDDTLLWNKKLFEELCLGMRQEKIDIEFLQVWSRSEHLSSGVVSQLDTLAQVVDVCLGIESTDPTVLKVMRKGTDFGKALDALHNIKQSKNIVPTGFWIAGHPGSNAERESNTTGEIVKLMEQDLCLAMETSIFTPYPGTAVYEDPARYGVEILTHDWSNYHENPPAYPPVASVAGFDEGEVFECYLRRTTAISLSLARHLELSLDEESLSNGWQTYMKRELEARRKKFSKGPDPL